MKILIVAFYSSLLGLLLIFLSLRIIRMRRLNHTALGDGDNIVLRRAIRAHANFTEYVPFSLILLSFIAWLNFPNYLIHLLGILLVVSRFIHAWGLSQIKENYKFRTFGMAGTFTLMGIIISLILYKVLESYIF